MPRTMDLTDETGGLHALAPYRLAAVMIYPEEKRARQTLLEFAERPLAANNANPCNVDGPTRGRPRLDSERFRLAFSEAITPGVICGGVLMALIRLAERKQKPGLSRAVELLTDELSKIKRRTPHDFEYVFDGEPSGLALKGHRNKSAVLKDWHRFRNVAHLWAAHTDLDGWYGDPTAIKDFLRAAERWMSRAQHARLVGQSDPSLIDIGQAWRFDIPATFRAAG